MLKKSTAMIVVIGLGLMALADGAVAANDPSFISDEQFKEACQRFAQEDGIQPAEINEYLSQCLMDLRMANSPGFDDESTDIVEPPVADTKKSSPAPAQGKAPSNKK
ncbi:MAG: hypothetical protein HQL58_06645 [Magnetococcales bacterium]|nr:hypothetical protein [Magnetococcales bacterium]